MDVDGAGWAWWAGEGSRDLEVQNAPAPNRARCSPISSTIRPFVNRGLGFVNVGGDGCFTG